MPDADEHPPGADWPARSGNENVGTGLLGTQVRSVPANFDAVLLLEPSGQRRYRRARIDAQVIVEPGAGDDVISSRATELFPDLFGSEQNDRITVLSQFGEHCFLVVRPGDRHSGTLAHGEPGPGREV